MKKVNTYLATGIALQLIILLQVHVLMAQSPGGVSSGLKLWVKANSGVTTSGSNVTGWTDQTATNTFTITGTPQLTSLSVNFNPCVTFNGSSYFTGNTSVANTTETFAVASIQNAAGSSGSGAVVGSTSSASGNYFFHTESGILYFGNPGVYAGTNAFGNSFGWMVLNADMSNTPAANDKITANGIAYTNNPGGNPAIYSAVPTIGSRLTEPLLNGSKVAEVVIYNASKSTGTERSRIQSYLAVKYGLTLGNTSNLISYLNSAGTTIWTGDATYQNNVMGIGKDNTSALEQQISTSQSTPADIITFSTDNNFTGANGTHAAISSDGYFLMTGNNNLSSTTYSYFTSTNANVTARMGRIWKVQETGTDQGTIYIKTSNTDATYILTSPDATFGDGNDTYTALSSSVAAVNLSNGQYFTFGMYLPAPGGVLNGLSIWYKANSVSPATADNTTISTWTDNSGNYMTGTAYNSPTYRTGNSTVGLNFNPAMSLNGTNQYFQAPSGFADFTAGLSMFSVHQYTNTGTWGRIMDFGNGSGSDNILFARNGTSTTYSGQTYNGATGSAQVTTTANSVYTNVYGLTSWTVAAGIAGASASSSVYLKQVSNATASVTVANNLTRTINYIGRSNWAADAYFAGYVPEFVLYNRTLTSNEQTQVASYMGLKYGFTLGTPGSPVDYKASDGTTFWTGTAAYQYNVMGIGKDNLSGLEQQVSKSTESTADIITLSTDNNFTSSNGSHASVTNDKYFLVVGNNNLSSTIYTYFTSTNANVTARMGRIWKVQETGTDQGTIYIKTSNTDATYILTSPDATFGDGNDTYTALTSSVAAVNLSNGQYFTFGMYLPAPGGVLNGLSLWYKANSVSSATADNTAISTWTDNSGNYMTGTAYNSPTYRTGNSTVGLNFNPAMSLNGTNQYFQAPSGFADFTAGLSMFSVHQYTNTGAWARIMDFGNGSGSDNLLFARNNINTYYSGQVYNGASVTATNSTTAGSVYTNVYGMTGWTVAGGTPAASAASTIYLKGVSNGTTALIVPNNLTRTINYIGRSNWAADAYFAGYMPEFIVYNRALTNAELSQIRSYLALKYGFTMGTPGAPIDYNASDGTIIWTGTAAYQYNVMGIGKDNLSGLEQQISKSTESTADIITLSTDNNYTGSNGSHTSITNDKYFLMVGNNNASTSYSAYSGGTNALTIMSRIWKIQETGTDQGSIYIKTSSTRAQYLVISTDATFTDADTWVALSYGAAAVNLPNGQYFTFASSLNGPGGVATNLSLWNESNVGLSVSGTNITGWVDQSGTNTFTVTGTPQYSATGANFNPAITFNGSSYFTGNTSITNTTEAFAVASIQNASGVSGSGAVIGNTAIVSGNYFFHTESGILYYGNNGVYAGTNSFGNSFGWLHLNSDLSNTAANEKISVNGIAYTNNPGGNPSVYSAIPTIGSRLSEPLLNGSKIAEVVLYNASKSTGTERSRIQSYLTVKYGLTLGNTSNLVSYLNSAGTTIWTGDATYQNNITGIGKDNGSGLEQQISTSQSTVADILTISTDNNFTAANGSHTAVSSNNSFLMIGNNNVSAATTQTTDLNTSVFDYRLSRVWYAQVTGLTQTIYFQFSGLASPGAGKSWFLLTSSTPTFSSLNAASGSGALSSGVVSFNVSRAGNFYFTLAVGGNGTPLPVELLGFTAIYNPSQVVDLEWKTASEKNNDYFTIEKSKDLIHWNAVKKVKGAGNSASVLAYSEKDTEPYPGTTYYRLKQTDFDSRYSYSSVKSVICNSLNYNKALVFYPNPVSNEAVLEGDDLELSSVYITDLLGKDLTSYTNMNKLSPTKIKIEMAQLPPGTYVIRMHFRTIRFTKE